MTKARVSLNLPGSLKSAAERFADRDGVSLNQFIAMALAEKVGALDAATFFAERAGGGDPVRAIAFLRSAPDVPPLDGDERKGS
jgi:hypothetical protein